MCESNVYLATEEAEELVMEDVTSIRPEGQGYRLVSLFGEEKLVRGRIREIDLLKHRLCLNPYPEADGGGRGRPKRGRKLVRQGTKTARRGRVRQGERFWLAWE